MYKIRIILDYCGHIETSIGALHMFALTIGDQNNIRTELGRPIRDCDSVEYAKKLIRYSCFPNDVVKDKVKPDNPVLTDAELEFLTAEDIEALAKLYIEWDSHKETGDATDSDENEFSTDDETLSRRQTNESFTDYLARRASYEEEDDKRQHERILSPFLGSSDISRTLNEISNNMTLGASLKNTMEGLRSNLKEPEFRQISNIPIIDFNEIEKRNEQKRLRPFNDLSERLDSLIKASTDTVDYLLRLNKTQSDTVQEIKSSSDQSSKDANTSIRLNVFILGLTAITVVLSGVMMYSTSNDGENQHLEQKKYVDLLFNKLNDINTNISEPIDALKKENDNLRLQALKHKTEMSEIKNQLDNQGKELQTLRQKLLKAH